MDSNRWSRRAVLRAAVASAAGCVGGGLASAEPSPTGSGGIPPAPPEPMPIGARPPNLIVLLTDDQRADSLSCAGNPVLRTPHIDALAADGVRFANHFATTAICVSSRASILTGQYSRAHGIWQFDQPIVGPAWQATYPMQLKRHGYRVGFVGKWGLGEPLPTDQYDYWAGYAGQASYFEPGSPKHLTVRQGEQAVEFLRGCRAGQPFCLAVSFKAPHVQDEGRTVPSIYPKYPYDRAYDGVYTGRNVPGVRTVDERPMPAFFRYSMNVNREGPDFKPDHYQETMADLYRLLTGVDDAVGRIMAAVRDLGFGDDTVVLYSSDHGSFYGEHGWGGKWLMYEESIRSPLVVFDPRLPHRLRGTVREQMACNVDLAPTLLDLAGVPAPAAMQGRSLVPLMWGRPLPWRTEFFYEHHFGDGPRPAVPASEGVRSAEWKYIRYPNVEPMCEQLYHLPSDPREERDLSDAPMYRPVLDAMRQRWRAWGDSLSAARGGATWVEPT